MFIKISHDLFSEMAGFSTVNRLVYVILMTKANPIGIVKFNAREIAALASVSHYDETDLRVFGKMVLDLGNGELLMTRYLKEQWKTLSRKAPPHKTVWRLLHERWGPQRPDRTEPFRSFWIKHEIGDWLPDIQDEFQKGDPVPEWAAKYYRISTAGMAKAVIPAKWNIALRNATQAYLDMRHDKLINSTTKADLKYWSWSYSQIKMVIDLVQRWIDAGAMPHQIDATISGATLGEYKSINAPKGLKSFHENTDDATPA